MPEDDAFVKIISRLGVDYSQAITSTRQLAAETERLDKILAQTRITAASLSRGPGQSIAQQLTTDKIIYDQYGRTLSVVAANTQTVTKSVKTATDAARVHAKTVKDVSDQYNVLGSQFERRASWFLAGSAFFGSIATMRQAATTIAEVEMGMTQIARITEDATFNFTEMRDELLQLGKEYGMTWDKVQDISLRWAQAGYNVKDTMELTRASLLALNTAELNANYATQGLIAIMAQWGLTAGQLLPTIDKINKVADDFAVTSQDLVDGLNRSSGAARVLGLNLNETIAILTVMREASGRTGREVGNALNSILSFMQRDVALQAFAREGIAVWADAAHTQFRSVIDIFDEVAKRWPEMSEATRGMFVEAADQAGLYSEEMAELAGTQKEFNDLQQRDLSSSMAGIYRRNYLLALLQNWAKIDKVLISAEDSLGYSLKENERTMATLAKQYESLKAEAQELAVAIGDTGLLNGLKEVVSGVKDVIDWFNELDPASQRLIVSFVEVTAAVKILNAVFRMAGAGGAASLLSGWAVSATTAAASTRVLTSAVTGLGTVLMNVGRGIVGFFGGPLGLALTVATTGLLYFTSQSEESAASMEQNSKNAAKLAGDLQGLLDRYTELANNTNRSKAEQDEFKTVTDQLLKLLPHAITGFDDMGNAISNVGVVTKEATERIGELKAEYASFVRAQATVGQAALPGLREQLELQQKQFEGLAEMTSLGASFAEGELLGMSKGLLDQIKISAAGDVEVLKMAESKLNDLRGTMANTRKEIAQYEAAVKAADALESGKTETAQPSAARTPSPGYVGAPPDKKKTDAVKEQIKTLSDVLEQFEIAENMTEAALSRLGQQINVNASEYDYLTQKIQSGAATSEDYIRAQELTLAKTALLQKEQDQLRQTNAQYADSIGTLTSTLEEATRQYEAFKAAGDTEHMRDAQQVVTQLQGKINDLNSTISQNTSKLWENQQAIMETKRALSEDYFERLDSWIQHMASVGRLTAEQQLQYYKGIDRTTLSLQSQWKVEEQIYNLRRQSLQDEMDKVRKAYDERMREIEEEIEAEEESTQKKVQNKEDRIKAIDEETDAQIKAIQDLIDALDIEGEQSDREEAEKQHNEKLADLRKEKQYHELRTGMEHLKAIDDINEQMAEEEHAWELKKQDWARQDKRDAYQEQIDALRDQARVRQDAIREEISDIKKASDQKKKQLQRYYDDIQDLMDTKVIDLLAALSGTDEQWYQRGIEWMRRLAEGIRDGQTELPSGARDFIEDAEDSRDKITPPGDSAPGGYGGYKQPAATFSGSEFANKDGRTYAWSQSIARKLGMPVSWDEKNWQVMIGGKGFSPDYIDNDRAFLGLRRVGEAFGYNVRFDEGSNTVSYFPKAHTGAYVAGSGIAELLQGERVLSPRLTVSFDRLANVLANFPNIPDRISLIGRGGYGGGYGDIDRAADRIIAAIERRKGFEIGTLFNAEKVEFADRDDMGIFSRELVRAANAARIAKGR
jgi:hypothetical protein